MMPFYTEWTFHVLVGVIAATAGVLGHRAWARRRWRLPPAGVVHEAVLALDLVNSTELANHYGDRLAMRARNFLEEASAAAGRSQGLTFIESTGDGSMMTFPSVFAATQAALSVVQRLRTLPAELASGPPLQVRAAVAYGVILLDAHGQRHGATINKAFRMMSVTPDAFVTVEGEQRLNSIPDRDRVFLDEACVKELHAQDAARQVGVCRLKGFDGFHRVFELRGSEG
ncbi:MAG TPA: adenylate/guanylate cyclase domain-containing protein [Methyloceanibacter sp.]|nr:adenylate/guanylate cyclase domain-containing protein [Methyloceanibacter sp.]